MSRVENRFQEGARFRNENTNELLTIVGIEYNHDKCDIEYKLQKLRFKFNIFKVCGTVIANNLESGDYKQIER